MGGRESAAEGAVESGPTPLHRQAVGRFLAPCGMRLYNDDMENIRCYTAKLLHKTPRWGLIQRAV
jgi:hypothetical protein